MGIGIEGAGSSGVNLNMPVIRPDGKQSQNVEQTSSAAQTGQVQEGVSTSQSKATEQMSPEQKEAIQAAKEFMLQQQTTVSRHLTSADILKEVALLGPPATKEMVTQMVKNRMPITKENINFISQLTQGNNKAIPAAILSMLRGVGEASTMIADYMQAKPQVSQQNQDVQLAMQNFMNALQAGKGAIPSGLAGQLAAIAGKWDKVFTNLPGNDQSIDMFSKEGLIEDVQSFKSLLKGVKQQLQQTADPNSREISMMFGQLTDLEKKLSKMLKNYTAQAVLSKPDLKPDPAIPDRFAYWLLPNFLTTPPSDLEIIIQRDSQRKNKINPDKTIIVMKMETDSLGEIAFEIKVSDSNVDFRINTEDDSISKLVRGNLNDLSENMKVHNLKVNNVQVIKRILDIKKILIPDLDLDGLTRVSTQV